MWSEVAELSAQVSRLREEVSNATSIRHEEAATNEKAIKDVQDVQSNLMQDIRRKYKDVNCVDK